MKNRLFTALLGGALLAATGASVLAQSFPSKPIRIIVAFSPGGGNDLFGRIVAQKLQERLGQPVVVENKVGAGGNIGVDFVAKSPPDGYTLLVMTNASGAMVPSLFSKPLPFDVLKDFAPIGIGAGTPMVVVVSNKLPVNSIEELIAYVKANSGKLSYATPGVGTMHHLVTEIFMSMTGAKMVHVPYKGAAGVLADLMSGEVHVAFAALSSAAPFFRSGKIRLIAVTERERLPLFKDVPTVHESLPGYEANMWFGLVAPAGTPESIVNLLSEEQRTIVKLPDARERLAGVGLDPIASSVAEMRQSMSADFERFAKVVKVAGLQPQ